MKKALYLVLKNVDNTYEALESLKASGFNATIISSESLRHALEEENEDKHFYTLRHLDLHDIHESLFCLFVVDDNRVEELKKLIRSHTENFEKVKGFMFTSSISDYEGSI
ncbi:MAG: hypothetical protein MJ225_04245 [Bacilli bacterium]|nr:hypothetical protein [Bacilli bacterium]